MLLLSLSLLFHLSAQRSRCQTSQPLQRKHTSSHLTFFFTFFFAWQRTTAPCVKQPGGDDVAGGGGVNDALSTSGAVNVAWHPTLALCAASVGRRLFLVDGVSGAVLASLRIPVAALALAYSPPSLGARLVVLLCDGSLHDVDAENSSHGALRALHPPTGRGGGTKGRDKGGGERRLEREWETGNGGPAHIADVLLLMFRRGVVFSLWLFFFVSHCFPCFPFRLLLPHRLKRPKGDGVLNATTSTSRSTTPSASATQRRRRRRRRRFDHRWRWS